MIIQDSFVDMQVGGVLDGIFCRQIATCKEDALWAVEDFRVKSPSNYRQIVLDGLRMVIESTEYSYAEKAGYFVLDHCDYGEVHAEDVFRRSWALLTDDPYPEHPAPLQMEVMIIENEIDCSTLRALLVCCYNREANKFRLNQRGGQVAFRISMGVMGFNPGHPETNKFYAKLLRDVILDTQHTFVEKAKFFIRDYYQDGEEAAREIFKRIFADICPREPNPLA